MIEKDFVYQIVSDFLKQKEDYFLVDVAISKANAILVEIDAFEGVDIDTCCEISRFIESKLDREVEDYELEVGSVGITSPFKILQQYQKNIGNEVEVLTKDGRKWVGVLVSAEENSFTLEVTKKVKTENSSKKQEITESINFSYSEIKQTKYNFRFK